VNNLTYKIGDKVIIDNKEAEIIRVFDDEKCYPYSYIALVPGEKIGRVFTEPRKHVKTNSIAIPLDKLKCANCTLFGTDNCLGSGSKSLLEPDKHYCFQIYEHFKGNQNNDNMKWLEEE